MSKLIIQPISYVITAKREGGEEVFFCWSQTQSRSMVPLAFSMAYQFNTRTRAKIALKLIKEQFKGLRNWKVEQRIG